MTHPSRFLPPVLAVAFAGFLLMWFSAQNPRGYYDYTDRIAAAFLEGRLGMDTAPPPHLNEMVPVNGRYYSVFPLGSVLSVLPLSWLAHMKWLEEFPVRLLIAILGAAITALAFLLTWAAELPMWKRLLYAATPLFGSCLWANLAFGGAWQIAIGFAVAGMLGAMVFTLVSPRPLLAGFFFAMSFGNRTELLLTAPIFYYLLLRHRKVAELWREWPAVLRFSAAPLILGVLTLAYNAARFGSPLDFGYARIPGVLDEPWYKYGIFSAQAIPSNVYHMLFEPWKWRDDFPWLVPTGWGGSLFLYSPFLFLLFRHGPRDYTMRTAAWSAIAILTILLWIHGNAGGWQVSYRYAAPLFPWALLLLVRSEPRRRVGWSPALILAAVAINAFATWLFCATDYLTP